MEIYASRMEYTTEVAIGLRKTPNESLSYALSKLSQPLEFPRKLSHIVVKPSIYDPALIGNTALGVVEAVVHKFKSVAPLHIVESDNPLRTASVAFAKCGYDRLIEAGVDLVNLSHQPTKSVVMPGNYFENHPLPTLLQNDAILINVPTVKLDPDYIEVGAGIKNLFGLLPETDKRKYHERLNDILVDLLTVIRPTLTVVDLTELAIGNREDGIARKIGAIIVGRDPVAVDAFCADLLNKNPMKIDYIKRAHDLGLGEALLDRIHIIGTEEQKDKLSELCRF